MTIGIEVVDAEVGLYVLVEDGKNVLHADSVKYGLKREWKRQLLNTLLDILRDIVLDGESALRDHIGRDELKKIVNDADAVKFNLWEVRSPKHGGRIFFVMDPDGHVIVSAVEKTSWRGGRIKAGTRQDNAIKRGVRRWESFLKN